MSAWRRKALELLPELSSEIQDPDTTPMLLMFTLLGMLPDVHGRAEEDRLRAIYGFVCWCMRHSVLQNAAAVGFIEHLADRRELWEQMPNWIPRDIYYTTRTLLQGRMSDKDLKELDRLYR